MEGNGVIHHQYIYLGIPVILKKNNNMQKMVFLASGICMFIPLDFRIKFIYCFDLSLSILSTPKKDGNWQFITDKEVGYVSDKELLR